MKSPPSTSDFVAQPIYQSAEEAGAATDEFYATAGFEYTAEQVRAWLAIYLPEFPKVGAVLDLCCGDGIWSQGIKAINPMLKLHGIDISRGGINRARQLVPTDAANFVVGDAEVSLPWREGTFDLIFARGTGLFNQHSMDRPAAIAVLEMWHRALKSSGRMVSIFYSDPKQFGTYTNPLKVTLPYNRAPRLTEAVDFTGGKFHHTEASFLAPFRKAANVRIVQYRFVRNNHILATERAGA